MQLSPRLPWYSLLTAVVLVPLAVGVVPLAGVLLTLNAFVDAKLVALSLALAIALASWAVTTLRERALHVGRALVPLGAFLLVAGVATVAGIDPRQAFFGDSEQGVGFLVILLCGLACWLTTQLVRDEERLRTLTSAVVLTATAVAVIGLLQQTLRVDLLGIGGAGGPLPEWILMRGYGTIGNADTYGAYLVLPALLALHRLRRATASGDRLRWGACFLAIATSCFASQTRGPLVGLLVGGVAYAVGERAATRRAAAATRKSAKKAAKTAKTAKSTKARPGLTGGVVAAAVGVGVFVAAVLGDRADFFSRFGGRAESLLSLGGRLPLWRSALRVVAAHPVLGVGPDSFRLGWYPVRQIADVASGVSLVITDPHSAPLLIAATMGLTGLVAAVFLIAAAAMTGLRTSRASGPTRWWGPDYDAWLYGFLALCVTLLGSMVTSVLVFMLFLALGVLIAPALRKWEPARGLPQAITAVRAAALLASTALLVFGVLGGAAQAIAVGTRTDDADLARARAAAAVSLAPWDSGLRKLEAETMVTAALKHVFESEADAPAVVDAADKALTQAARRDPREYLLPYRAALLLIGSGQRLGTSYVSRGIDAGRRGLEIYPNSLELRTGMGTGYLQLGEPGKAEALLREMWGADPAYIQSGVTYVEALAAQGKKAEALAAFSVLSERFPGAPALTDLEKKISSD